MSKTKWDKKATSYTRFTPKPTQFQQKVFDFIAINSVKLNEKRVLDIGCGTGVYTLHLAKKALHVDALDFSEEMLKILNEDAKRFEINNINTIAGTFDAFESSLYYDIAFCSMSPAVSDAKSFEKMDKCAKTKIFLGWGGKRQSSLHDPIFKSFGSSYHAPSGGLDLLSWLKETKKDFRHTVLKERRESVYNLAKAIENVSWHLDINGVTFSTDKLVNILKEFEDENQEIVNVVDSEMVLAIWS